MGWGRGGLYPNMMQNCTKGYSDGSQSLLTWYGKNKHQFSCEFRIVRKILNLGCGIHSNVLKAVFISCYSYDFIFCLVSMKKDIHENKNILSGNVL